MTRIVKLIPTLLLLSLSNCRISTCRENRRWGENMVSVLCSCTEYGNIVPICGHFENVIKSQADMEHWEWFNKRLTKIKFLSFKQILF